MIATNSISRTLPHTLFVVLVSCVLIFGLTGCKGQRASQGEDTCIDESKIDPNKACYKIYKPVCGCNGETYSNDCMAAKAGVTTWTDGPCE